MARRMVLYDPVAWAPYDYPTHYIGVEPSSGYGEIPGYVDTDDGASFVTEDFRLRFVPEGD